MGKKHRNYNNRVKDNYEVEKILYRVGLITAAVSVIVYIMFWVAGSSVFNILGDSFGECPFKRVTGFYCPGCGGTRAAKTFLQGHFLESFSYNAFIFYCMVCYLVFMVSYSLRLLSGGKIRAIKFHMVYVYIGIGIAIIGFIIKNAMFR